MKQNWRKNTAVFMTSQAISIFGSSLVQYAITWYITLSTKSGIYATISILCGFLPTLLLSPFAGVWADRYNRKFLIILADGGIAISTLILAIVFMLGYNALWLLFVASAIRALGSAVQSPCVGAILPDLAPEDKLTRVNGVNGTIQSLILLVSPMLSGALLGMASIEIIFFIDVVTAFAAIYVLFTFLKIPHRERVQAEDGDKSDYFKDLKQGFSYIGKHGYLVSFFVFCAVFFVMAAPVAFLTPLQVARSYGVEVWRLTAIELTFSIGMTVGGVLISAWGGFKNRVYSIALATFFMGICTIIMGLPILFWLYLAMMALFGLVMPFLNTPAMVFLQERVEPDYLGRVMGVMTMINSSMMPLGMLIFGPISDYVRIEWLLLGTGAVILTTSISLLFNKPLLKASENVQDRTY